jgi:oligosaccharide repeat unit polymerase
LGCSLLVIASSVSDIIQVLNGDMGALRLAQARGESTLTSSGAGGAFHSIVILANTFGGYSMIMLLFYFYSICFLNKTKLFNSIILLSSMTVIAIGILGIDRSKSVYWLITYGFMLILFWRHMSSKQHKQIIKVTGIICFLVLAYFLMVTFSRFNDGAKASQNSMIWYAGQSFLYFSYFFDNVNYEVFSLQRIFPWFYNLFIENGINSTNELNVDIQNKTNTYVGVFSTFIGDIMVASGKFIAVAYCIIFYFISKKLLNFRNNLYIDFHQLIFLFCLITIPMLGVFTHFYASHSRTIPFLFFIGYGFYLKFKIKTN